MKASKDPFEASLSEQDEESPPESPTAVHVTSREEDDEHFTPSTNPNPFTSHGSGSTNPTVRSKGKAKEDEEEDEEEMEMEEDNNMELDTELGKLPLSTSTASASESTDPHKMAKMQSILSQFTEEQMTRYESFRRSGFQKSIMKRLLVSITGSAKISVPMTIVVSGIAKMFVGELVETARVVMAERNDSGPIRPCHIRESYRRLKLEGKIPKRSVPRLFR